MFYLGRLPQAPPGPGFRRCQGHAGLCASSRESRAPSYQPQASACPKSRSSCERQRVARGCLREARGSPLGLMCSPPVRRQQEPICAELRPAGRAHLPLDRPGGFDVTSYTDAMCDAAQSLPTIRRAIRRPGPSCGIRNQSAVMNVAIVARRGPPGRPRRSARRPSRRPVCTGRSTANAWEIAS